jgi:hypothetical protein
VLPLYAQGYSLARYLIEQGGKRKFMNYVGEGMRLGSWTKTTEKYYGFRNLSELQVTWLEWVRNGMPKLEDNPVALAQETATLSDSVVSAVGTDSTTPSSGTNSLASFSQNDETSDLVQVGQPGWYARVRDQEIASRLKQTTQDTAPISRASNNVSPPTEVPPSDVTLNQSVSRPQPVGRPQQIILEWSRPPGTPTSAAPIQPAGPASPISSADSNRLIPNFQGTLWR